MSEILFINGILTRLEIGDMVRYCHTTRNLSFFRKSTQMRSGTLRDPENNKEVSTHSDDTFLISSLVSLISGLNPVRQENHPQDMVVWILKEHK